MNARQAKKREINGDLMAMTKASSMKGWKNWVRHEHERLVVLARRGDDMVAVGNIRFRQTMAYKVV